MLFALQMRVRPEPQSARSRGLLAPAVCVSAWLSAVDSLHACPSCAAGVQARSQVLANGFSFHLIVALLPFLIIGAICWGIESRS
jgi:hypothetical protein